MKVNENNVNTISVIVPIYNGGDKIHKCIRSILKQSYKDIKLILVDDGSTDGSGKICDDYATKDSRVNVIHQKNSGSVIARRTGVLHPIAQSSAYITFVDADDMLPFNALECLKVAMEFYKVDLVCGRIRRKWKKILVPTKFIQPCFENAPKVYNHEEIIQQLYVSCFGITNFPVNLYGKLYKTELITKAIDAPAIVKFMGDDLSVTLSVLPNCNKLVIIPKVVYHYYLGGYTSKYMPYMLQDFISLYQYKQKMAQKYPMPFNVQELMDVELMNILKSYFYMCAKSERFTEYQLLEEIKTVCSDEIIQNAAKNVAQKEIARQIIDKQYQLIAEKVVEDIRKNKMKERAKKFLLSM